MKFQTRLRSQGYIFLSCRRRSGSSCPCADRAADQGSLAPSGQSANQRTTRCATADETKVALVVILSRLPNGVGLSIS